MTSSLPRRGYAIPISRDLDAFLLPRPLTGEGDPEGVEGAGEPRTSGLFAVGYRETPGAARARPRP
ncbi:MAG: hypothetical protein M3T55_11755, partial [Pseudomonadota bacterium]|nr:hypothetical protein [Pseudomonadota bacterium]